MFLLLNVALAPFGWHINEVCVVWMCRKNQFFLLLLVLSSSLLLSACSSGSGSDTKRSNTRSSGQSAGIASNDTVLNYQLSGYVLDGAIIGARVCLDKNNDGQCSAQDDYFTTTDNRGHFELGYHAATDLAAYRLLADVRMAEARDDDYVGSQLIYDYQLSAYNPSHEQQNIVISPLSSMVAHQVHYRGVDAGEAARTVELSLLTAMYPERNYSVWSETEGWCYDLSTDSSESELVCTQRIDYLNRHFVDLQDLASEQEDRDFYTRLHQLNQLLAREMQQSQQVWENTVFGEQTNNDESVWQDHASLIYQNANAVVYDYLDFLLSVLFSESAEDFDALSMSYRFWPYVPDSLDIDEMFEIADDYTVWLQDYKLEKLRLMSAMAGSVYQVDITTFGLTINGYYYLDNNNVKYYMHTGGACLEGEAPLPIDFLPAALFVPAMNLAIEQASSALDGVSYEFIGAVDMLPIGCIDDARFLAAYAKVYQSPVTSSGVSLELPVLTAAENLKAGVTCCNVKYYSAPVYLRSIDDYAENPDMLNCLFINKDGVADLYDFSACLYPTQDYKVE